MIQSATRYISAVSLLMQTFLTCPCSAVALMIEYWDRPTHVADHPVMLTHVMLEQQLPPMLVRTVCAWTSPSAPEKWP